MNETNPSKVRRPQWNGPLLGVCLVITGLAGAVVWAGAEQTVAKRFFAEVLGRGKKGERVQPEVQPGSARLHTGWTINPLGVHSATSDMPSAIQSVVAGKFVLVVTAGWGANEVLLFRTSDIGRGNAEPIAKAGVKHIWRGAAVVSDSPAGALIAVSGASDGTINRYRISAEGELDALPVWKIGPPEGQTATPFIGSIVSSENAVYAVDETKRPQSEGQNRLIKVVDGKVEASLTVGIECSGLAIDPSRKVGYLADAGLGKLHVIDLANFSLEGSITVGSQPGAVKVGASGSVYVVNGGDDSISIVDPELLEVVETVSVRLTPKSPLGATPTDVAISKDETKIAVSNGHNNAVCLIERRREDEGAVTRVQGFLPTGRFPTTLAFSPDESHLWIGIGKGFQSSPNKPVVPNQPDETTAAAGPDPARRPFPYILSLTQKGAVTSVAVPDANGVKVATDLVFKSSPYRDEWLTKAPGRPSNSVLPDISNPKAAPFEHVFYIIKENRTYDQVFGDLPQGNGDPTLAIYGRQITPNHHRLAEQFVLLDNTYCDGEVSQDGWEWSTAAMDSDWDIRVTAQSYGRKPKPPHDREVIRPANRYLWEQAGFYGKTYFSYGAKTDRGLFSPTWKGRFSKEWNRYRRESIPDYKKADLFIGDFKAAVQKNRWHNLTLISLTDDHTSGTRAGAKTPFAYVASNDWALGKIVEAITQSPIWEKSAIFVIEDDAQNGPDHVDAHRTVALVISPFTARGSVDSTFYTSTGMVRSIGLALGLPPLSQHDAAATPMFRCFTGKKNLTPYHSVRPDVDLDATNPPNNPTAALSESLDWSDVDLADFGTLNRILWQHARPGVPYPAPKAGFVRSQH